MEIQYLLKGLLVGVSVSAPLGPIGVLSIQRTINKGLPSGIVSGFGAALADTVYAVVAAFGLTIISDFLINQQTELRFIGGGLLIYLGIKMLLDNPIVLLSHNCKVKLNPISDFFSVFLLTMSNPLTIIVFGAIFAGLGLARTESGNHSAILLTFGIFAGATLWWLILSTIVSNVKHKIKAKNLIWINRVSGILISILGLFAAGSIFFL